MSLVKTIHSSCLFSVVTTEHIILVRCVQSYSCLSTKISWFASKVCSTSIWRSLLPFVTKKVIVTMNVAFMFKLELPYRNRTDRNWWRRCRRIQARVERKAVTTAWQCFKSKGGIERAATVMRLSQWSVEEKHWDLPGKNVLSKFNEILVTPNQCGKTSMNAVMFFIDKPNTCCPGKPWVNVARHWKDKVKSMYRTQTCYRL